MYSIDIITGVITFPDGCTIPPPYDHPRYLEYANWVNAGNSPEEIESDDLIAEIDIEVTPAQARTALSKLGVYEAVKALMSSPDTPEEIKIKWEYTMSFRRNDPAVLMIAKLLKWSRAFLDELFTLASSLA